MVRAIVIEKFGGPDSLVCTELPDPEPEAGQVVIDIKAFGLNHAEMHMRRGEWAEAAKVSGIECVGLVASCPGGEFPVGTKAAALMGGLGRTVNGSYAEYTRASASNVALIESDLPWAEPAVIPETYATAWTCLFRNLEITPERTLVIRGATSAFGQAAVNLAVNAGAHVIGTTRNREHFALLEEPNPLLQMASGVYLTFFGSFVFGTPGFPLSDVPLQAIAEQVAAGRLKAKPSRVFRFEDIHEAHRVMEAGEAKGKMVVVLD
ncbi:zinc-binding dehydrogenase [Streptomyces yatensis]|uniref:Enoyl reductase (ER) domain-containing protein n=1 Tax=Streptomyces yatensis TaxID=155177 RepID=A0ABN2IKB3_9ACTN|nr:zinc-binding dehydrogenase [Streptomyces yatensis]